MVDRNELEPNNRMRLRRNRRCATYQTLGLLLTATALYLVAVPYVHTRLYIQSATPATVSAEGGRNLLPLSPIGKAPAAAPKLVAGPIRSEALPSAAAVSPKKLVAYVVTVTEDGHFVDGAAVLAHSIMSVHKRSQYASELMAFVSPRVSNSSRKALRVVGFNRIMEKELPINVTQIAGKRLREQWSMDSSKGGCCGAWELLKLYAWTLTDYYRVVHVDMDCMLLQPIDELFDIDATLVYTADYNMMNQKHREKNMEPAVQGGFLVIRPSFETFHALVAVEQEGNWDGSWAKSGIGSWWGGSTIQGLLPYYFAKIAKIDSSREVDRCIYDNMIDAAVQNPPPRIGASACRQTRLEDIKFVHWTVCQKPWSCRPNRTPDDQSRLCVRLHKIWFQARHDVERALGLNVVQNPCAKGYRPIELRLEPK